MTSNINIITARKGNVLIVPSSAVREKNTQKVVSIFTATSTIDIPIITGIRGIDGNVEVIYGISEGSAVVIPQKSK